MPTSSAVRQLLAALSAVVDALPLPKRWHRVAAAVSALIAIVALVFVAGAQAQIVRGPDVSSYQGTVNWRAVHAGGYRFGFAKAIEGRSYTDPQFSRNWGQIQHEGLVRGAYDFGHPSTDPRAEALRFVRTVNASGGFHRAIAVLDLEVSDGQSAAHLRGWTATWVATVRAAGHPALILIYTGAWFWNPHVGCWSPVGVGLWVSAYTAHPILPCGFQGYDFWQLTDRALVPGIGRSDLSVFSGPYSRLLQLTEGVPQKAYGSRVLRPGARGTDVRGLQGALNRQLHARRSKPIKADGIYGRATSRALRFAKYHLGFRHGSVVYPGCTRLCERYVAHPDRRPKSYRARGIAREHAWRYAHANR